MNEYDIITPYLVGVVSAVVAAIVVKVISSKAEKQYGYRLIEPVFKTITLRCPNCNRTFTTGEKTRPFKLRCPYCEIEGTIK